VPYRWLEKSEKIGPISHGINLLLVVIKYTLTVTAGSGALLADAIHSFSDVISSATIFREYQNLQKKIQKIPFRQM